VAFALLGTQSARAASVALTPTFSAPHLGEASPLTAKLEFSGTEYGGSVAPLGEVKLQLPAGVGESQAGLPVCEPATLRQVGPTGCPAGSVAGAVGELDMLVSFGTERVHEKATFQAFVGPPGALTFAIVGESPISLEEFVTGTLANGVLTLTFPSIETVPGRPQASITALTIELGSASTAGSSLFGLTLPMVCPQGSFAWSAEVAFRGAPNAHASAETPCPERTTEATETTLQTPNASPIAGEVVTYEAVVTPRSPASIAPTGTVAFFDRGAPISACTAQPLTPAGVSSSATCRLTASWIGTHSIAASYGGSPGATASSSASLTVTVYAPSAQVALVLRRQLMPRQRDVRIGKLLRKGYTMPFAAIEGGTVLVRWFASPTPRRRGKAAASKPTLIATGTATFASTANGYVPLKLTAAGGRILRRARSLRLTSRGIFTSLNGRSISATRIFTVKR
jgi:hypothetical protein